MNQEEFSYLINHICFPCKLPSEITDGDVKHELLLLNFTSQVADYFSTFNLNLNSNSFIKIKEMLEKWSFQQGDIYLNGKVISESLSNLKKNDTSVFYLRAQNCCLRVNRKHDLSYTLSAFQASASDQQVMSIESDLLAIYPTFELDITNTNILCSESFGTQLAELANTKIDHAVSSKGGITNVECRDVPTPKFVFEWIAAILVANHSTVITKDGVKVFKKLRDDIIHSSKLLPFRRSGLLMSIKVVLQLRLYELFGNNQGKIIYKIIMILFVNKICQECLNYELSTEIMLNIIQKLTRRLYKFEELNKEGSIQNYEKIAEICCKNIEKVRTVLDKRFENLVKSSRCATANLDLGQIELQDTIHRSLQELQTKIKKLKSANGDYQSAKISIPNSPQRNYMTCEFPNLRNLRSNLCLTTSLYDIESWIQHLSIENILKENGVNSLNLVTLLETYISKATSFYANDELGSSRMILVSLKLVCLLDALAVNKFTLLKEHNLGFDTKPLESLLMPLSSEISYVGELIKYIEWRNNDTEYESIVDCEFLNENTFGIRFASMSVEMQNLKKKILKEAEEKKRSKILELESKRKSYNDLLKKINGMNCLYNEIYVNRKFHNKNCSKCSLQKQANSMRVKIFEWPLPQSENLRNQIIFELIIPEELCYLRDGLHLLRTQIFGYSNISKEPFYGNWINNNQVSSHALKIQRHVTFGSNTKLFSESHYGEAHPREPDSEFLKPNGYKVKFCSKQETFIYKKESTYESKCTFKAPYPYNVLQWTINNTTHTENDVLAAQSKCPQEISIREFVKYGCFRAGHRLQMRNLLDAIETQRSISLKKFSVYALFAQVLWQIGKLNVKKEKINFEESNFFYPESHEDFSNSDYILKLHECLSKLVVLYSKCWDDHIIMLNIIIIIARAISLAPNHECRELMVKLLLECRFILQNWAIHIVKELSCNLNKFEQRLKENLFEISCFSILTFYTDKQYLKHLFNSSEHVIQWLNAINYIYDNSIFSGSSNFRRNLYRQVLICILENEEHIYNLIKNNENILSQFVSSRWSDSCEGVIKEWFQYEYPAQQWYHADFIRNIDGAMLKLQLSINGGFLVQGFPVCKLPELIYQHPDFKAFFVNTNFDVATSCNGIGTYVTKKNDSNIDFTFYSHIDGLIIKERRKYNLHENMAEEEKSLKKNTEVLLYLKKNLFDSLVPYSLINMYSHWLNIDENVVEFRSNNFSDYLINKTVYFKLNLNDCSIYDVCMDRYLIDIQSKTFKEFYNQIAHRLETSGYTHMFEKNKQLLVEFPRMGLAFEIDLANNVVVSRDFPGMMVSYSQQIDTLIGLEKGLVLCEKLNITVNCELRKKQIVIPNGSIKNIKKSKIVDHHQVEINIQELNNPPYYSYEIDYILKKLRGEESITAWLYLAFLHATSSHVLPDPFLGITGTEMSLQLLQSGNCWSTKPFDTQAIKILNSISALSPKRQYYPVNMKVMQVISWPDISSTLAAREEFKWIAQKLINDSYRLSFTYPNCHKQEFTVNTDIQLSNKAFHRNKQFYCNTEGLNLQFKSIMHEESLPVLAFTVGPQQK